jgi:phosphoenolpyruvate synthase/pyruvate phosphate dikinase
VRSLDEAARAALELARKAIPRAETPYEVLALRFEAHRTSERSGVARGALAQVEPAGTAAGGAGLEEVDEAARLRLWTLRSAEVEAMTTSPADPGHRRRALGGLDRVLGSPPEEAEAGAEEREAAADAGRRRARDDRWVLGPSDGGFELGPLIGWKGANLGEIDRALGPGLVPSWFAVTRRAFETMLASEVRSGPGAGRNLGEAILRLLGNGAPAGGRAAAIRALWEEAPLPPVLSEAIERAYRALGGEDPAVAVRSSGIEEDVDAGARPGEFDTFLFVRGVSALAVHVRRTWAGFWNERAIARRDAAGSRGATGGGVLVQLMVDARASGVLQTVNVAGGRRIEMVVEVGLGLGEGIVSGKVGTDRVIVPRGVDPERDPLRFRYETREKRVQVVFDARAGSGTAIAEALYHQRFRPALEYTELADLVRAALRLERHYRHPVEVEFSVAGSRLWILQVRPVADAAILLEETIRRYPLAMAPTVGGAGAGKGTS